MRSKSKDLEKDKEAEAGGSKLLAPPELKHQRTPSKDADKEAKPIRRESKGSEKELGPFLPINPE
jgi:hypothetical protein